LHLVAVPVQPAGPNGGSQLGFVVAPDAGQGIGDIGG